MNKRIPERFSLIKCKLLANEALDVHFEYEEVAASANYVQKEHVESPVIPHPDLTTKLQALKPHVAKVYGFAFIRELVSSEDFKATDAQLNYSEKFYQTLVEKIRVTGIALSGKEDAKGCIITAVMKSQTNSSMAINTHRISFKSTTYGFEDDLKVICDDIENEVFRYLFEGKQAQLSLFPEGEE